MKKAVKPVPIRILKNNEAAMLITTADEIPFAFEPTGVAATTTAAARFDA
jgi:hypothetical protein